MSKNQKSFKHGKKKLYDEEGVFFREKTFSSSQKVSSKIWEGEKLPVVTGIFVCIFLKSLLKKKLHFGKGGISNFLELIRSWSLPETELGPKHHSFYPYILSCCLDTKSIFIVVSRVCRFNLQLVEENLKPNILLSSTKHRPNFYPD